MDHDGRVWGRIAVYEGVWASRVEDMVQYGLEYPSVAKYGSLCLSMAEHGRHNMAQNGEYSLI